MTLTLTREVPSVAIGPTQLQALRRSFGGDLIVPDDADYSGSRRVWNPAVDEYPTLIARCSNTEDVATIVRFAREHEVPITVRGGGHSFAGFGVRTGSLMIDLSRLKAIRVWGRRRTATAQPGLTWGEFNRAAGACGLATTGADIASVGIAGMTLGGGMGWLHRVCGAACDNLLSAQVVLADGGVVRASQADHPDLFWALHGGGGNFGIATSLEYRLHPIREIVGGFALHPIERARDGLALYRELCETAPDELRLAVFFITAPPARFVPETMRGRPAMMMCAAYFGGLDEGERQMRRLRAFGPPTVDLIRRMRYVDLEHHAPPAGLHHHGTGEFLRGLDDRTIDVLADAAVGTVSPFMIILVNQLGGALARVPDGATAFSFRQAAHTVGIHCMWSPGAYPDPHVAWAQHAWEAIRPASAGGAAINLQAYEGEHRVREAYGPSVYARLAELKARYDPDNVFRTNCNVKPAGSGFQGGESA